MGAHSRCRSGELVSPSQYPRLSRTRNVCSVSSRWRFQHYDYTTYLAARLLGILRRDESHCLEPLPSREERHYHHLKDHDGRIEGVGLEQFLLHVEHVGPDRAVGHTALHWRWREQLIVELCALYMYVYTGTALWEFNGTCNWHFYTNKSSQYPNFADNPFKHLPYIAISIYDEIPQCVISQDWTGWVTLYCTKYKQTDWIEYKLETKYNIQ